MSGERFTVSKVLRNLWEIHDAWQANTEFVLFADIGINYARLWLADEASDARSEALRLLAEDATRAGVSHSFVPPPGLSRVTYDKGTP